MSGWRSLSRPPTAPTPSSSVVLDHGSLPCTVCLLKEMICIHNLVFGKGACPIIAPLYSHQFWTSFTQFVQDFLKICWERIHVRFLQLFSMIVLHYHQKWKKNLALHEIFSKNDSATRMYPNWFSKNLAQILRNWWEFRDAILGTFPKVSDLGPKFLHWWGNSPYDRSWVLNMGAPSLDVCNPQHVVAPYPSLLPSHYHANTRVL